MNDQFRMIQEYDRLEQYDQTDADLDSLEDRELAQDLAVIRLLREDAARLPSISQPEKFSKKVVDRIGAQQQKRARTVWWSTGLALAATLVIGFFLFSPEPGAESPTLMIDPEMLDLVMKHEDRSAMLSYLEETEKLLVSIRDFEVTCADNQMNITSEKELARSLLLKQKHFSPLMNRPEYFQARQLFGQLENILVGLNTMDLCTDLDEMDLINQQVNKKRILSKLRLVAQEIQLS